MPTSPGRKPSSSPSKRISGTAVRNLAISPNRKVETSKPRLASSSHELGRSLKGNHPDFLHSFKKCILFVFVSRCCSW
jgi:hypothetical protein